MNTQLKRLVVVLASSAALVLPVSTAAHAAPSGDAKPKVVKVVKTDGGGATTQRIDWE